MDKPSIHDIRLRFSVKGLWSILSSCCNDIISNKDLKYNKDITLNDIDLKDHTIKTRVHRTNTVTETPPSLTTLSITYSQDCSGVIHPNETKTCTISNYISPIP